MKASDALAKAISQANLRRLAGDRYYERGLAYFEQGAVYSLERSGDSLNALVVGSEEYEVRLLVKGQKLDHRCDCPLGFDGEFCKHCVAVGLAWLDQQETCSPQPAEVTELAKALQAKDKTVLVKLLLDHAEEDDIFRERLLLLAAGPKGPTVAHTKKMLAKAMQIRGFMDYHHRPAYAAAVEGALDAVEAVLQGGEAAATVDLCEDGLRNLLTAIAQADDSDGYMSQLMERLLALHLRACEAVRPDPDQLARTLFSFALNSEYGEWSGCAERYANVLGKQGLSTFRKLAETEWANVPPITQRDTGTDSGNRFLVTDLMESLARQSGDLEELVGVLERDLSSPHRFLRIAHVYREAGNHEKALAWAQKGVANWSGYEAAALRVFVAEEWQRRERHAAALRIVWIEFRNRPGLSGYSLLRDFTGKAGEWDDWRAQALAFLRRSIPANSADQRKGALDPWDWNRDRSLLVEILLDERRTEEAWQEAQAGGCNSQLWLRLAEQRQKQYPDDAASVYLRLGEHAIAHVQDSRYDGAVELLEKAAALLHSLNRSQEFEQRFERLRKKFKLKRNLQKLVEERRSFLYL
jgi:uncharacterized Zn finger protein